MLEEKTFNISLGTIATHWERLGAAIIDGIIVYMFSFFLGAALATSGNGSPSPVSLGIISFAFPYLIYFPIPTILWGGSPGKLLMKLKVVSSSYEPLSPAKVYLRETLGKIVGIFCLGALWLFFNPRHKTAWDFIANSLVVKKTTE